MKRGLSLAINSVILIALGIAVLLGLILMFVYQEGYFKDFLDSQGKTNVDIVLQRCDDLVSSGSEYSYCCEYFEVVFEDREEELRCVDLAEDFEIDVLECGIDC